MPFALYILMLLFYMQENNPTTTIAKAHTPGLPFYKPNSRGTGGVIRFELNADKGAVFVEAANQAAERQFDWETKIVMKWGLTDIGEVLALLQHRQPQAKLFHKTESSNSNFEIHRRDDPDKAPYIISFSRQETADKSLRKVAIPMTHGEAALLESALRSALARMLNW